MVVGHPSLSFRRNLFSRWPNRFLLNGENELKGKLAETDRKAKELGKTGGRVVISLLSLRFFFHVIPSLSRNLTPPASGSAITLQENPKGMTSLLVLV